MRQTNILSWMISITFLLAAPIARAETFAGITTFSPQGIVKNVRQVRVRFSEDMIAFGDPRASENSPFIITCPTSGKARWADTKNWIYDFDADLPGGIICKFDLKTELKSKSGHIFNGQKHYELSTGGPSIKRTEPWEGSNVDEEQIFVLHLDAEVDLKSVRENAYFMIEGISERVGLDIVEEDPRSAQKTEKGLLSKVKLFARKFGFATRQGTQKGAVAQVLIQARRRFPPRAKVKLIWGKEVSTLSGLKNQVDQILPFTARPEFFAEFNCERENAKAACLPISNMTLSFNAPVLWKWAKEVRLVSADNKIWKPWNRKEDRVSDDDTVSLITFKGPFFEKTKFKITLPRSLRDDADRPLANADRFPLEVATDEYSPLLKFPAPFGIIELKPEAILPLTVRNVEADLKAKLGMAGNHTQASETINGKSIRVGAKNFKEVIDWMLNLDHHSRERSIFTDEPDFPISELKIKKPNGERAFEVLGIPLKKPGLYVVEFESQKLGEALLDSSRPMYVPTIALVTNLSVHFKLGRESSLVWVTSLDQGQPVENAQVSVRHCDGSIIATGKTDASGRAFFNQELIGASAKECKRSGYSIYNGGNFVVAEKDDDFSFVHTNWDRGIEYWRFGFPGAYQLKQNIASTVFDRTLFRAGETVHMKHFLRKHTGHGLEWSSPSVWPKTVRFTHQESAQSYDLALNWKKGTGTAENTWEIPKSAKLGIYTVTLLNSNDQKTDADSDSESEGYSNQRPYRDRSQEWVSGSFRVEEFRVPLMKGNVKTDSKDLVQPKEVHFDFSAEYLSGGVAAKLPIKVRYQTSSVPMLNFQDFDDFSFGNGKFKGRGQAESPDSDYEFDLNPETPETTTGAADASAAKGKELVLDSKGGAQMSLPAPSFKDGKIKHLEVEMDYSDPNGQIQTSSHGVNIFPSSNLVAVKTEGWMATKSSLKFQVAVADLKGHARSGAPVQVELLEQIYQSHRKRLVGGFYSYENRNEIRHLGQICSGKTDEKGLFGCDIKPPTTGNLILEAKTEDSAGNASYANTSAWVYDQDETWYSQEDSDRIDLLPEKKNYEVGEVAKFQVRMPFREATALVTVEREGVLDSFVTQLSGKKPIIEVPIKSNDAPNVYVSAFVVRGRVGDVKPTALLDLGKPAYKLGMSSIRVGWKPHLLQVKVSPSQSVFQIREKGKVKIQVKTAVGANLPAGSEAIVAIVDEGLLQLKQNESWDLLASMMQERGLEVQTSTAQSQVVGKRHFGLKALAPGGDGGKAPTRELFDTLLYWNPSVPLDEKGEAEIEFKLNDSITSYQIAVVAHAGSQFFGKGISPIQSNQELMILSGVSPIAREGDELSLEWTVRNSTDRPMTVELEGRSKNIPEINFPTTSLAAHEAKKLYWPVKIPFGVSEITYQVNAREKNGKATDRIEIKQKIKVAVPVRVYQGTLTQMSGEFKLPIEIPKDAIPDRGGIRVSMDSTLLSGLSGVKDFMGFYPYSCYEQRVSKAIALRDKKLWQDLVSDTETYLDGDGLIKYFPSELILGSEILTSYVLAISHEAGWDFPEQLRSKMISGLEAFIEGRINRLSSLPTSDLTLRRIAALEAISRYGAGEWKQTSSFQINPNLWPTSGLIDWINLLRRLKAVPEREQKIKEADQILRARINFQGTLMSFSTDNIDELWWMMVSVSSNANRFVLSAIDDPLWKEDMSRVVRGALYRQKQGHWGTTTANTWGVLAMEKFAKVFEKDPVTGKTLGKVGSADFKTISWGITPSKNRIMDFEWPKGPSELKLEHQGSGKPWATIQSRVAIPLKEPFSTGYRLKKTIIPVEQKTPGQYHRGDILRVKLEMESQSDMTWVVVNDPVPAGATLLGTGLGGDSNVARSGEKSRGWAEPAFIERTFESYRAYYEFVPKGTWSTEYTYRLNQVGKLNLPPSRIEAMYAPEMLGETPNSEMNVLE